MPLSATRNSFYIDKNSKIHLQSPSLSTNHKFHNSIGELSALQLTEPPTINFKQLIYTNCGYCFQCSNLQMLEQLAWAFQLSDMKCIVSKRTKKNSQFIYLNWGKKLDFIAKMTNRIWILIVLVARHAYSQRETNKRMAQ